MYAMIDELVDRRIAAELRPAMLDHLGAIAAMDCLITSDFCARCQCG